MPCLFWLISTQEDFTQGTKLKILCTRLCIFCNLINLKHIFYVCDYQSWASFCNYKHSSRNTIGNERWTKLIMKSDFHWQLVASSASQQPIKNEPIDFQKTDWSFKVQAYYRFKFLKNSPSITWSSHEYHPHITQVFKWIRTEGTIFIWYYNNSSMVCSEADFLFWVHRYSLASKTYCRRVKLSHSFEAIWYLILITLKLFHSVKWTHFQNTVIDGNKCALIKSQSYNLVRDILNIKWVKFWVMRLHRLRNHNVLTPKAP